MKLCIVLLFISCSFVYSFVQETKPITFPEEFQTLNEEEQLMEAEGWFPASKWITEMKDLYKQVVFIRNTITKRPDETIEVMDLFSKLNLSGACDKCQDFFKVFNKIAKFKVVVNLVKKIAIAVCERNNNEKVCKAAITRFGEIAYAAAVDRMLNPLHACERISMCPRTTEKEKLAEYIKEVLKDKPQTNYPSPSKRATYTVLQLTDPHIDLQYQEGANAKCEDPLCCREENGMATDPSKAAGYWGTQGACDIPLRTFDQFLQFTARNFKIDMVLWLGDNIAHDIWQQDEEHQVDNTYDATQKIMQYFPNASIYPMFGNHEPFPADQFDFLTNSSHWLTDKLADMWKPWLDEQALKTFKEQSYYATVNEKFNVKIIALDMLACDINDFYLLRNPTDPNHQLEWLRKELYDSEAKKQGVYLLGHIPPGDYGCYAEWSYRYRALVDRFTNIIRGQFFGHSHDDHFMTVRSFSDNSAVGTIFISPSLTTFSNLLPSIRIYEMDAETNQPINYHQFRLDLDKWNKNTTGPIDWDHVYSAVQEYGMKDMSFASMDNLADRLVTDKETAMKYLNHMYVGQHYDDINKRDLEHLYCSAKHSVSEDHFRCLGLDATIGDLMNLAKQMIPGGWFYDKC